MRILVGFCLTAILLVGLSTAQALTLATTTQAFNNGLGPGGGGVWQGSQNYSASPFFTTQTLDADVEFAVFAPGKFQDFLNENLIIFNDPAPSEYIYAYQIVNIAPGTTPVTTFSVGMNGDENPGLVTATFIPFATDYGSYPHVPIQDIAFSGGPSVATQASWPSLSGSPFTPGEKTPIVFYSSPDVPEMGLATVNAGLAGQFLPDSLPNPVPEPTTLALCIVVGLGLICRRRI